MSEWRHSRDGIKVTPPAGLSAYGYLSKELPRLPKAALPHPGDKEVNQSSVVISLDDVALQDDDMMKCRIVIVPT